MNFSPETVAVLKNFATINGGLVIKPGNLLRVMHKDKSVMGVAEVDEEFEFTARIFDLTRFLATLSLFSSPQITAEENRFVIRDAGGKRAVTYSFAAEGTIVEPPSKDIRLPSEDLTFELAAAELKDAIKAAGVLGLPQIAFVRADDGVFLSAVDAKGAVADTYRVQLSDEGGDSFEMPVKIENLKLMPLDYTVTLSKAGLARFEADKLKYFVALERKAD